MHTVEMRLGFITTNSADGILYSGVVPSISMNTKGLSIRNTGLNTTHL